MMASTEITIELLEIGKIANIGRTRSARSWQGVRPWQLEIEAKDGTKILADASEEAIGLLEMTWAALTSGGPSEDDEQTLADLRAVYARREARFKAVA
jgi:hypothetical protein